MLMALLKIRNETNDGWYEFGAQGPQGNQGFQGTTGAQGNQGNQGNQGAVGAQGTTGAQGSTGAQGAQGATGAQGAQGAQGATGDTQWTRAGTDLYPTNAGDAVLVRNAASVTKLTLANTGAITAYGTLILHGAGLEIHST